MIPMKIADLLSLIAYLLNKLVILARISHKILSDKCGLVDIPLLSRES